MEKVLFLSDDITEDPCEDAGPGGEQTNAQTHAFPSPIDTSGQVLVTFRGVAVDENIVRFTQQRALELGLSHAGTLHALLTKDCAADAYLVVVQAGIDARRFEHCARADNALSALHTALEALIAADPSLREHARPSASSKVG